MQDFVNGCVEPGEVLPSPYQTISDGIDLIENSPSRASRDKLYLFRVVTKRIWLG